MKKVFASDFDGTLYFYKADVKLPPESVKKIHEYQAAGHLFGLCTGRQVGGLTPFITGEFEPDFMITASGSYIVDKNLKPIFEMSIDADVADKIVKMVNPDKYKITLDVGGEICVFAEMDYPGLYYVIKGVDDLPEGKIHQVSIHTESLEEAAEFSRKINELFGDYVQAFQNVIEVDIAPKGCSKGKGVEKLKEIMHDHLGDCRLYGIGDSINDMPLLEASEVSYTFPYAPEQVQNMATKVLPTIVDALEDSMND